MSESYSDWHAARKRDVQEYGVTSKSLLRLAEQRDKGLLTNEDHIRFALEIILRNHPNG